MRCVCLQACVLFVQGPGVWAQRTCVPADMSVNGECVVGVGLCVCTRAPMCGELPV